MKCNICDNTIEKDNGDIIESLEVIEDKLHSLDELLDIAIGESYKLNKEKTNENS